VGARFSAPVQTGPGAHPNSCTMGTGSSPGVKSAWGVTLTPHPLLVPWSRKGRAIPLLPLWAVRPVQSLSACTRVTFTFTFFLCFSSGPQEEIKANQFLPTSRTHMGNRWSHSSINPAVDRESSTLYTPAALTTRKKKLPARVPKIF